MSKTLIIAEAGVNHNGSLTTAKELIDIAASAGADYIKFQTFKAENLVTKEARKASYQECNCADPDNSQYKMLKRLELSYDDHFKLIEYCREKGIGFLSTAFDLDSVSFLENLNLSIWKIPSGEITNLPYLRKIAATKRPILLSTGMCRMEEVGEALQVLTGEGVPLSEITVLHCNTQYPTPMEDVNLRAMDTLAREFGVNTGYSDHTPGIEVSVAAVARGAKVIEKHFTLDKNLPGPDHRASLDPSELKQMIQAIRHVEQALGCELKQPSPSEIPNIIIARKSIVAARNIRKGEILTEENITCKRPGDGITPMKWDEIIGTAATRDFSEDEKIEI